ncbi:MAG: putative macrolide-specific efflux protein [Geminicoccaceae bacterium]|nr:putative macrolide-specific efflux protein [Geminicoccaceae bacterium]
MTKKTRFALGAVVLTATAAGLWIYRNAEAREAPAYRFATITRGDLESTVSATGALSAVTTVQVGTQVSGQVSQIYVDFNDRVKKGQLLARIDPTLQQQAVLDAQAGLIRAQADLERSRSEYERQKTLFEAKVLTATEFNTAQYNYTVAQSSVKSAQVALDRARKNLSYTAIHAPIDGVVVERNVDVGQTVAASLSAPQLFLIANNLSQMQILASVDESDIGLIHEGQEVRFSVQAYPNQNFTGTVKQVRLQSTTTENVVNYTVVVSVSNPKGTLLPGMTATVDFLTGTADDVLIVPNAALRFRPTAEMLAAAGVTGGGNGATGAARTGADSAALAARRDSVRRAGGTTDSASAAPRTGSAQAGTRAAGRASGTARGTVAQLWYVDSAGKPAVMRVRTGLTDGQNTEVSGPNVREGMQVIIGTATAATAQTPTSPFQQQRRGPGGF